MSTRYGDKNHRNDDDDDYDPFASDNDDDNNKLPLHSNQQHYNDLENHRDYNDDDDDFDAYVAPRPQLILKNNNQEANTPAINPTPLIHSTMSDNSDTNTYNQSNNHPNKHDDDSCDNFDDSQNCFNNDVNLPQQQNSPTQQHNAQSLSSTKIPTNQFNSQFESQSQQYQQQHQQYQQPYQHYQEEESQLYQQQFQQYQTDSQQYQQQFESQPRYPQQQQQDQQQQESLESQDFSPQLKAPLSSQFFQQQKQKPTKGNDLYDDDDLDDLDDDEDWSIENKTRSKTTSTNKKVNISPHERKKDDYLSDDDDNDDDDDDDDGFVGSIKIPLTNTSRTQSRQQSQSDDRAKFRIETEALKKMADRDQFIPRQFFLESYDPKVVGFNSLVEKAIYSLPQTQDTMSSSLSSFRDFKGTMGLNKDHDSDESILTMNHQVPVTYEESLLTLEQENNQGDEIEKQKVFSKSSNNNNNSTTDQSQVFNQKDPNNLPSSLTTNNPYDSMSSGGTSGSVDYPFRKWLECDESPMPLLQPHSLPSLVPNQFEQSNSLTNEQSKVVGSNFQQDATPQKLLITNTTTHNNNSTAKPTPFKSQLYSQRKAKQQPHQQEQLQHTFDLISPQSFNNSLESLIPTHHQSISSQEDRNPSITLPIKSKPALQHSAVESTPTTMTTLQSKLTPLKSLTTSCAVVMTPASTSKFLPPRSTLQTYPNKLNPSLQQDNDDDGSESSLFSHDDHDDYDDNDDKTKSSPIISHSINPTPTTFNTSRPASRFLSKPSTLSTKFGLKSKLLTRDNSISLDDDESKIDIVLKNDEEVSKPHAITTQTTYTYSDVKSVTNSTPTKVRITKNKDKPSQLTETNNPFSQNFDTNKTSPGHNNDMGDYDYHDYDDSAAFYNEINAIQFSNIQSEQKSNNNNNNYTDSFSSQPQINQSNNRNSLDDDFLFDIPVDKKETTNTTSKNVNQNNNHSTNDWGDDSDELSAFFEYQSQSQSSSSKKTRIGAGSNNDDDDDVIISGVDKNKKSPPPPQQEPNLFDEFENDDETQNEIAALKSKGRSRTTTTTIPIAQKTVKPKTTKSTKTSSLQTTSSIEHRLSQIQSQVNDDDGLGDEIGVTSPKGRGRAPSKAKGTSQTSASSSTATTAPTTATTPSRRKNQLNQDSSTITTTTTNKSDTPKDDDNSLVQFFQKTNGKTLTGSDIFSAMESPSTSILQSQVKKLSKSPLGGDQNNNRGDNNHEDYSDSDVEIIQPRQPFVPTTPLIHHTPLEPLVHHSNYTSTLVTGKAVPVKATPLTSTIFPSTNNNIKVKHDISQGREQFTSANQSTNAYLDKASAPKNNSLTTITDQKEKIGLYHHKVKVQATPTTTTATPTQTEQSNIFAPSRQSYARATEFSLRVNQTAAQLTNKLHNLDRAMDALPDDDDLYTEDSDNDVKNVTANTNNTNTTRHRSLNSIQSPPPKQSQQQSNRRSSTRMDDVSNDDEEEEEDDDNWFMSIPTNPTTTTTTTTNTMTTGHTKPLSSLQGPTKRKSFDSNPTTTPSHHNDYVTNLNNSNNDYNYDDDDASLFSLPTDRVDHHHDHHDHYENDEQDDTMYKTTQVKNGLSKKQRLSLVSTRSEGQNQVQLNQVSNGDHRNLSNNNNMNQNDLNKPTPIHRAPLQRQQLKTEPQQPNKTRTITPTKSPPRTVGWVSPSNKNDEEKTSRHHKPTSTSWLSTSSSSSKQSSSNNTELTSGLNRPERKKLFKGLATEVGVSAFESIERDPLPYIPTTNSRSKGRITSTIAPIPSMPYVVQDELREQYERAARGFKEEEDERQRMLQSTARVPPSTATSSTQYNPSSKTAMPKLSVTSRQKQHEAPPTLTASLSRPNNNNNNNNTIATRTQSSSLSTSSYHDYGNNSSISFGSDHDHDDDDDDDNDSMGFDSQDYRDGDGDGDEEDPYPIANPSRTKATTAKATKATTKSTRVTTIKEPKATRRSTKTSTSATSTGPSDDARNYLMVENPNITGKWRHMNGRKTFILSNGEQLFGLKAMEYSTLLKEDGRGEGGAKSTRSSVTRKTRTTTRTPRTTRTKAIKTTPTTSGPATKTTRASRSRQPPVASISQASLTTSSSSFAPLPPMPTVDRMYARDDSQ